jgi:hypothetical protein
MNWYKQIKIALPVDDSRYENPFYLSVGHKDAPGDKIWVMYKDFSLDIKDLYNEEGKTLTHLDLWPDKNEMFARGRYEAKRHTASVVYFPAIVYDGPISRMDFAKKRVIKELDRAFGNPRIFEYN